MISKILKELENTKEAIMDDVYIPYEERLIKVSGIESAIDVIKEHENSIPNCGECSRRRWYQKGYKNCENDIKNTNWISLDDYSYPAFNEAICYNASMVYESEKVFIQTQRGEHFAAYCRHEVYSDKKYKDRIEWYTFGTGGRKMKVMSKVVAWQPINPFKG